MFVQARVLKKFDDVSVNDICRLAIKNPHTLKSEQTLGLAGKTADQCSTPAHMMLTDFKIFIFADYNTIH